MPTRSGFSFIELMIVIAIMAMVIITAPPMLQWIQQQGVSHAADQLRCDLQLARMTAISRKKPCAIVFNHPGPNQYINSISGKITDLSSYRGNVHFLDDGPDHDRMSEQIVFCQRGMAVPAGDVYLSDENGHKVYRILILAPGSIDLLRWDGRNWH
jgi:prepilin-type N-terminal cleavage/methylation domain-containing protein